MMANLSYLYRSRAVACEQHVRTAPDMATRKEWQELAIQWHLLASAAAETVGEQSLIEVA